MSNTQEERIDLLLSYMKDDIESNGRTPRTSQFNFNTNGEHFVAFKENSGLTEEDIDKVLKICHSRGYIKRRYMGGGEIICLTTEGHGRAISYEAAKSYVEKPRQQTLRIGAIHGPTQIGNNNIQNIEGVFEYLINGINGSDASEEEKREAKSLLKSALDHPLTSAIIGSSIGAIITMLGG